MDDILKSKIEDLAVRFPTKRAALLPALWLVQDRKGWITPEHVAEIARAIEITPQEVREAMSFYTLFSHKRTGKHHIQVCIGVCCRLRGADEIVDHLKQSLGIDVGESTPDGLFHLSTVECLGSCGTAPMMQVDNDYYESLTAKTVDDILNKHRNRAEEGDLSQREPGHRD